MANYGKRERGRGMVFKVKTRTGATHWRGQVTIDGRRRSVTRAKEGDARQALDQLIDGAESDDDQGHDEDDATVGEWLALWVETIAKTNCENTRQNRRDIIKRWRPIYRRRMADLLSPDVERVLQADAAKGYKKSTLVRMKSVLKMSYDAWNGRTQRTFNPAERATIPDTVPGREREALTAEQAAALREIAERTPETGLLVTLGLWFGLRPGEVAGLTWANVDTDAGTISVRRMRRRQPGEDGKQILSLTDAPKAKSFRSLAIPADVLAQLRRHKTTQTRRRLAAGRWDDRDLVVCTRNGSPIDPSNQRRQVAKMATAAGIFRHLTPNELRHTAATLLIDAGYSLTEVADFLGHKNERMLIETYRHKTGRTVDLTAGMTSALGA